MPPHLLVLHHMLMVVMARRCVVVHAAQLLHVSEVAPLVVVVLVLVAAVEPGEVNARLHVVHHEIPVALVVPEAVALGDDLTHTVVLVFNLDLERILREIKVRLRRGDAKL